MKSFRCDIEFQFINGEKFILADTLSRAVLENEDNDNLRNSLPDLEKGKQKSSGRGTSKSRSQPLTPGGGEKVTQINVCKH